MTYPTTMTVLVCGGRNFRDRALLWRTLGAWPEITHIIQGGADGADALAREYARANYLILTTFHANWAKFGKAAGPLRNQLMLDQGKPDWVVAFPGGKGTADMMRRVRHAQVSFFEVPAEPAVDAA